MIQVNEKYKPLWNSGTRYFVITGGRGSGKSYAVNLFLTYLTYEASQRILFTRYTMASAKVSIIPEFKDKIQLINESDFEIDQNEIVNRRNQSAVIFRGIKTSSGIQTAALKSLQGITTWVIDEAEELTDEKTFDKIDLSVRQKGIQNRVIIVMNPATKEHWIYKRFFESKGIPDGFCGVQSDTTYIHSDYRDNKDNLDESFLNQIERIRIENPAKYNHIILGGWLDKMEGVIFSNWTFGEFDESLPSVYGLDFGYSVDPTALVRVAIKGKTIYVKELVYDRNLTADKLAQRMQGINGLVIADSAEPRMIDELRNRGYNVRACFKGADSVRNGVTRLLDYQLVIDGENIAKELNNYTWSDKKSNTPNDAYNHSLDALRYSVMYQLEGSQNKRKGFLA